MRKATESHTYVHTTAAKGKMQNCIFAAVAGLCMVFQPWLFLVLSVKKKPTPCWDFIKRERCHEKKSSEGTVQKAGLQLSLLNIKSSPHSLDNRTPCYFPLDLEQGEEGAKEQEAANKAERTRWQWVPRGHRSPT